MIEITTASVILARLKARKEVKRELQKQGLKPAHYSAKEITSWANVYLDDHAAELVPAAIEQARRLILSGALGKRAQRALIETIQQREGEPK